MDKKEVNIRAKQLLCCLLAGSILAQRFNQFSVFKNQFHRMGEEKLLEPCGHSEQEHGGVTFQKACCRVEFPSQSTNKGKIQSEVWASALTKLFSY